MTGRRILIADDHPLLREGLGLAVRHAVPDTILVSAGTIGEAESLAIANDEFALVLLDLMLPDTHGFSGLMRLQSHLPKVPIAIITACSALDLPSIARDLGAVAFLSKAMPLDQLAAALRAIVSGERIFPAHVESTQPTLSHDSFVRLSQAQRRVLLALADGSANKQIAHDLGVSEATIKAHLTAIFRQLGVTNRMQAMLVLQPILRDLAA